MGVKLNHLWHASPTRAGPRIIKTKHFNNLCLDGVKQPVTCNHAASGQSNDQIYINGLDLVNLNGFGLNYVINQIPKERPDILEEVRRITYTTHSLYKSADFGE